MNSKEEQTKKKPKNDKRKCIFKYFVHDFVKWTGAIPVFIWFRLKCIYENKNAKKKIKNGALICANHLGFKDPIILHNVMWYRRLHTVALKELFERNKVLTWFLTKTLCIPINRENVSIDGFKNIINVLKDKKVVAIFPEGHINHNENQLDFFKSGIVLMAMLGNVPIVPMAIIKKEKWYQRQKVVIGEPIYLPKERMNLNQIDDFCKMLRIKEEELKLIYYNKRRKNNG